jgi:hypothetical protein
MTRAMADCWRRLDNRRYPISIVARLYTNPANIFRPVAEGGRRMPRHLVTLLIFSLALLASACADQSAFAPSQGNDERPALSAGKTDDPATTGKKSPGGSAGGWRK